ncbi:hypothetical protein [Caminibacter sp.]
MKIVLILFSVILFATEANVKYVGSKQRIYIYVKSKEAPKEYKFPNLAIKNGKLTFLGKFNFFHNGNYYVGEKYKIKANDVLFIEPLKIIYNSKTYTTKPLKIDFSNEDFPNIYIFVKKQKSNFFNILTFSVLLYIIALIILLQIKTHKAKKRLGVFENDIKKFYYFLATNNFEEVETLNSDKKVFSKNINDFEEVVNRIITKITKKEKIIKEVKIFSVILLIFLILKVFV